MKHNLKLKEAGLFRNLLFVSLVAGIPQGAEAATADLQNTAQANPNLIHQWSFDGEDVSTAGKDLKGSSDLAERIYGTPTAALGYNVGGFDGTSKAFSSNRAPGGDSAGGAYLKATGANQLPALGDTFSFEIIVKPAQDAITGGTFNLGYVLSSRSADNASRGYFLMQGDGILPSPTHPFSSTLGNGYNAVNTNIITGSPLTVGDWYYVAGSYTADPGGANVTWTNYYANLTTGGPLVTVGPFTNSGGTYPRGAAIDFGIGGRYDGQEAFPGSIDEVNLYSAALDGATFQAHLDQLLITDTPELRLSIRREDQPSTALVVFWSAALTDATLESSPNLADPWTPVTEGITVVGDMFEYRILLPSAEPRFFFRLRR